MVLYAVPVDDAPGEGLALVGSELAVIGAVVAPGALEVLGDPRALSLLSVS